jgi:hypothetical protein
MRFFVKKTLKRIVEPRGKKIRDLVELLCPKG